MAYRTDLYKEKGKFHGSVVIRLGITLSAWLIAFSLPNQSKIYIISIGYK
jgi:hypothetical protein